jgi:lysosomal acid phosphatase
MINRTDRTNIPGAKAATPCFLALTFVLLLCAASAFGQDKLVFALDLIRHGDRTPLNDLPTASHTWTEGLGQMTATGIQQEYQLGVKFRAYYVDRYHLLPPIYTNGILFARSTDVDRTLMSAQMVLMGLYPPGTGPNLPTGQPAAPNGVQPIPVHTVPSEIDSLLIPDHDSKAFNKLMEKYLLPTPAWKQKSAELEPRFKRWGEAAGLNIENLSQVSALADILYIYQLKHLPLPSALEQDAQTIIQAGQWAFVQSYRPSEVGRATGGLLLKQIADCLQQVSAGKTSLRYVLFSAHDSTILSEMSALGSPMTNAPPYSCDLKFALFKTPSSAYRIEVTLNDQPVRLPAFHGASGTLAEFESLAEGR